MTLKCKYEIVEVEYWHINELMLNMSEADRTEVWRSSGKSPGEALGSGIEHSPYIRTGLADNKVVCIWGVGMPVMLSAYGVP